jgi:hypothetical protein
MTGRTRRARSRGPGGGRGRSRSLRPKHGHGPAEAARNGIVGARATVSQVGRSCRKTVRNPVENR